MLCDVSQSEVFRSAFLRAIAWAVDVAGLPESLAKVVALKSCPLDIGCWKIAPITKPGWWPHVQQTAARLDTSPGEVWHQIETLWQQQYNSDTSEMLVHASGHVFADETAISDLEILGTFQKFTGGADPSLEEVAEWFDHRPYRYARPPYAKFRRERETCPTYRARTTVRRLESRPSSIQA